VAVEEAEGGREEGRGGVRVRMVDDEKIKRLCSKMKSRKRDLLPIPSPRQSQ
jgi:hypothetical protein